MKHLLVQAACVALGGGAGAVCRFLAGVIAPKPGGFPIGTLAVNMLGCFLIGLLAQLDDRMRCLVVTGFLGGFTTYSAFGLESLELLQNRPGQALIYLGVHIAGGLAAVWLGLALVR